MERKVLRYREEKQKEMWSSEGKRFSFPREDELGEGGREEKRKE